ncbi:MAG: hypothetical protein WA869_16555 [Alloacidobacterium sp.]|jgi:hypothetical protein
MASCVRSSKTFAIERRLWEASWPVSLWAWLRKAATDSKRVIFVRESTNRKVIDTEQAIWRGVPARLGMRDNFDRGAGRMNSDTITISPGPRMRIALFLAIVADTFQIVFSPLFFEGAASPADDILDLCMAGVLSYLLGWNWEFLPSFLAKLVPGADLIPLWTLAVANVYRRSKRLAVTVEGSVGKATERHARS